MPAAAASFPVIHSVLEPAALAHEVARQYELGALRSAVLLRSWMNEVYQIQTSQGSYILKVYRHGWRSAEEVAYEVSLAQHLAAHGLAVATPIPRRDGAYVGSLAAPEGQRAVLLISTLRGRPPVPPTDAIYFKLGQLIGRMHRALDNFRSEYPRSALDLSSLAETPLQWLSPHLQARPADYEFLQTLVGRVRARLAYLHAVSPLSWGHMHGDATLDNVLIGEDGQLAVYDFDQSGPGWRGYELQGVYHYASLIERPSFWESVVAGYRSAQPLAETDVAAMPCFVVLNRLWCLGVEAHILARTRGQATCDDAYFDQRLAVLRQWAQLHAELNGEWEA